MLPIITVTDLQRSTKAALENIEDYAVIQSHGRDVGFVLHPRLGKVLLESGLLEKLIQESKKPGPEPGPGPEIDMQEFDKLIGNVIYELSKK